MAYREFDGELDAPTGGGKFVPFDGELDPVSRGPIPVGDPLSRVESSTPTTGASTFSTEEPVQSNSFFSRFMANERAGLDARAQADKQAGYDRANKGMAAQVTAQTTGLSPVERELQAQARKPISTSAAIGGAVADVAGAAPDFARDTGLGLVKGAVDTAVKLPLAAQGLALDATGMRKTAESAGLRNRDALSAVSDFGHWMDSLKSNAGQARDKRFEATRGLADTMLELGANPAMVVDKVAESLVGTVAIGGVAGAAVQQALPKLTAAAKSLGLTGKAAEEFIAKGATRVAQIAAPATEGAQSTLDMAGDAQEAGRTLKQYALPSLAAGVGTAAIGFGANKLGAKLGVGDLETDIALRGTGAKGAKSSAASRFERVMMEGGKEAVLEEGPQSTQEAAFQNIAMGKPWDQGLGKATAAGLVTGFSMGGAHAAVTRGESPTAESEPTTPLVPPPAPVNSAPGAELKAAPIEAITAAGSVDEAIAAAQAAVTTPVKTTRPADLAQTVSDIQALEQAQTTNAPAVQNPQALPAIENVATGTPDASLPTAVSPMAGIADAGGSAVASASLGAGVGTDGADRPALDAGRATDRPLAGPVPLAAQNTDAVTPTMNADGTLLLRGNPAAIRAQLTEYGLSGIPTAAGVVVGRSQAETARVLFSDPMTPGIPTNPAEDRNSRSSSAIETVAPEPAKDPAAELARAAEAAQQRADFAEAERKRTAPGSNARSRAYEANPFNAFLGKHGISNDLTREFAPGRTERRAAMVQGYGPVFRRSGKQLDALAERAVDEGFLLTPDVAQLQELIGKVFRGERVIPQYAAGAAENEMQSKIDRQRQFEEDAADAVSELSDDALFDLEDHLDDPSIPWDSPSNTSEADAMRALGFTDQESNDAVTRPTARAQEDGARRGQPEQAASGQAQADRAGGNEEARAVAEDLSGLNKQPAPEPEGLTRPTREDVTRQQDRAEQAQALDDKAQIDREASGFQLQQQSEESRSDNTGDMFGGPSAEDALRARKPGKVAEDDGTAPMFSRSLENVAPVSRNPGETPLYEAFRQLSRFDDSFATNTSESTDLSTIAKQVAKGRQAVADFTASEGTALHQGNRKPALNLSVTLENGNTVKLLDIFEADSDKPFVVIGNSDAGQDVGGATAYQIAFAWAHNNGKTMRPDPAGLTVINRLRRTEAMISSALHFGTTKHLEPHQDQYVALLEQAQRNRQEPEDLHYSGRPDLYAELERLKDQLWTSKSDPDSIASNVQHLIEASGQLAAIREPSIRILEVAGGMVRKRGDASSEIPLANLRDNLQVDEVKIRDLVLRPSVSGVGGSTLKRYAVAASVQRAIARAGSDRQDGGVRREQQSGGDKRIQLDALAAIRKVLGKLDSGPSQDLKRVLYSRGKEASNGLTRDQLSSEIAKAFGAKVADRLESSGVVVPVETQENLPDHVVAFLREGDVVYGFFDPKTNKTYAVLENLKPSMVKGLVMHEVGVHYGFENMLGKDKYAEVLKRIDTLRELGNRPAMRAHDQAQAGAAKEAHIPEETLAYLVQNHPEIKVVAEVIAKIKAFLFNKFGIGGKNLTAADITMLARAAVIHASRAEQGTSMVPSFSRGTNDPMANRKDVVGSQGGRSADDVRKGAPTPDTSEQRKQGRPAGGMQERPAVRAVTGSLAGPTQSGGGAGSDANGTPFRVVDLFGNGSRVQHFDDRRGLFYEAQRYPSGRVGWKAGEVVDGNEIWLSDKEYPTMDAAIASVRGQRSANTRKANFDAKYGDIPNTWKGEAKKVATALIDAGHAIDRFSNSTQSTSKYIYLDNGSKVRLADHDLPGTYDQADFDFRYGDDIAKFVASIPNESPAPTNDGDPEFSRTPQTETKAFKDWFGDSKVVDDEGKPLVVYHGTPNNFNVFLGRHRNSAQFSAEIGATWFTPDEAMARGYSGGKEPMAVYLSMQNPYIHDADGGFWMFENDRAIKAARAGGHDGVIIKNVSDTSAGQSDRLITTYVTFSPTQIKSATGNRGTFDPKDPDIRFSRGGPNAWNMPEDSKTERMLYELQDGRVDLKRIQEAIKRTGEEIRENFDARQAETLYPGRVAVRTENFLKDEAKPMLEQMAMNKITLTELGDYLLARHAPERNAQIARVNPSMQDGGAGSNSRGELMTTQAAQDYLAAIPADRLAVLEKSAAKVDAITAGTRDLLVNEGLEKREAVDAWQAAYKNYVPLFKEEGESGAPHPQGTGFSVKGGASKRATGSTGEVTNVIAHVLMQREAAITRAEKNRVGLALYGLALSHPNKDFWTTIKPDMTTTQIAAELQAMGVDPTLMGTNMDAIPTIRTVDPNTDRVVDRPNPMYKTLRGAITIKINGEDRVLLLNEKDDRAMRMAESLKNMDGLTKLDLAGSIVGKATRWMAATQTQYNPAFGVVNLVRDVQGGLVNLSNTVIAGKQAQVFAQLPAAMNGIVKSLRDKNANEWSRLYEQYREDGAQTGYKEMFRTANDRAKMIDRELAAMQKTGKLTPGKVAHFVLALLDGFNTTSENAIRLSAYKTALDVGATRPQAAKLARELTVDFNRKGRAGREIGPLYAFFNASLQGTARTLETLSGPAGKRIIAGGLALGVLQALSLAAAGFDDDEIPEWVKSRALIIPLPPFKDKKYVAIPYPLGLHVLPNTGRVLAELTLNGGKDMGKRAFEAIGEIAGAFNPMGGGNVFTMDGALRTAAPTVVDPLIELGFNRNFAGSRIEKESPRGDSDNRPGFQRPKETTLKTTTGQAYLDISKAINTMTGGTPYEAGLLSPTPERVAYLAQTALGGVLRETEKLINAVGRAAAGETNKPNQIPLMGRFYGETDPDQVQRSRYFDAARKIDKFESSLKSAEKAGDAGAYRKMEEQNRELVQVMELQNDIQRDLTALNRLAITTVGKPEQTKKIDDDRVKLMQRLNITMKRLEEKTESPSLAKRLRGVTMGDEVSAR